MNAEKCWCGREAVEGLTNRKCIFHAPLEDKDIATFWAAFTEYYDGYVNGQITSDGATSSEYLDCTYFIFPPMINDIFPREVRVNINFSNAVFYTRCHFAEKVFKGKVNFVRAEFRLCPDVYSPNVWENNTSFYIHEIEFDGSLFEKEVSFNGAKFFSPVDFERTAFNEIVSFQCTEFIGEVNFLITQFERGVDFFEAKFHNEACFVGTSYGKKADFDEVFFGGPANFEDSEFVGSASFNRIQCNDVLVFDGVVRKFARDEDGIYSSDETDGSLIPLEKAADISIQRAYFTDEGRVYLRNTDISRWSFEGTDSIKSPATFDFTGVVWGKGKRKRKKVFGEGMIKEGKTSYEEVSEIYRRLRLNFETQLAFETASDFHIGQMEMMLLNPETHWLKKTFLCLYKLISNYGESLGRPLTTLTLLTTAASLALLAVGVPQGKVIWSWVPALTRDTYQFDFGSYFATHWDGVKAFWFAVTSFFTFRLDDVKILTWLSFIKTAYRILGYITVTLFILALRRAFRR